MLSIFATVSFLLFTTTTFAQKCCTYKVATSEWISSCQTYTDEDSCNFYEITKKNGDVKTKRNKCKWVLCENVGYCEWNNRGENGEKFERLCAKQPTLPKCIDVMFHKSGMCAWKLGTPPREWYDLLDDDLDSQDMEEMEDVLMVKGKLNSRSEQIVGYSDPYYMYVMMAILILSILSYGIRKSCKCSKGLNDTSPLLSTQNISA